MLSAAIIASVMGGRVHQGTALVPGPNHSAVDRSLRVFPDPDADGGFRVHSFAGDDPIECRDYVRARLGLPAWQPGDEQDRRVHLSRIQDWDRTIADGQATLREKTEDDLIRIQRAQALWNEAAGPRGTVLIERQPYLPRFMAGGEGNPPR